MMYIYFIIVEILFLLQFIKEISQLLISYAHYHHALHSNINSQIIRQFYQMQINELKVRNQTKESEPTQQLVNSNRNTNTIRRSQSDKRTLHLKTSNNEDGLISSRTKLTNQKLRKRFKTEEKLTTDEKTTDNKLQRNRSPLNQRFSQDHYNAESLAGLLDLDKQESKIQKDRPDTSKKRQSNIQIKLSDEDQDEDQEPSSRNQQRITTSKEVSESYSTYSEGKMLSKQSVKKLNQQFKVKAYSLSTDLQNIKDRKFIVKNQNQKRMEQKYWKGQQKIAQQIRNIKQFSKIMKNYELSKRKVMQQSSKKHEMKKIFHERTVNKASSLPKLKLYNVIESKEPVEVPEKQVVEKHIKNSLSSSKFELMKKKRRLCFAKDPIEEERENAEEVEKVLKSKGIEVEEGAVKKGLVSLRTLPDYSTDYFPSKDLFSNYIYKKYPL